MPNRQSSVWRKLGGVLGSGTAIILILLALVFPITTAYFATITGIIVFTMLFVIVIGGISALLVDWMLD
jgi:hypothetical protein